jgi:AraC-like DNA-binding protein
MLLQEVAEGFTNAMFYEKDKGNTYIRKALRFIADNYFEHLELAAVADFVQLSPSYFSTLFHQVVGMNFREYLCSVRVEESKRLLLSTEFSLADIAVSVGFPDQSYYCKVFKRVVGISPGKFRARPGTTEEESE